MRKRDLWKVKRRDKEREEEGERYGEGKRIG